MASAVSRLGKARRAINRRQRTANMVGQAASTIGTVAAFAHGQAKKADTAWSEYEEGYKAAGGDDFKRPKFGESGWLRSTFKGPEGEVSIGEGKDRRTYNIENLRKAGSFLGSEAAQTLLTQKQRDDYLGRTAPGKVDPLRDKLKFPTSFGENKASFGKYKTEQSGQVDTGARGMATGWGIGRKEVKRFSEINQPDTAWDKYGAGISKGVIRKPEKNSEGLSLDNVKKIETGSSMEEWTNYPGRASSVDLTSGQRKAYDKVNKMSDAGYSMSSSYGEGLPEEYGKGYIDRNTGETVRPPAKPDVAMDFGEDAYLTKGEQLREIAYASYDKPRFYKDAEGNIVDNVNQSFRELQEYNAANRIEDPGFTTFDEASWAEAENALLRINMEAIDSIGKSAISGVGNPAMARRQAFQVPSRRLRDEIRRMKYNNN